MQAPRVESRDAALPDQRRELTAQPLAEAGGGGGDRRHVDGLSGVAGQKRSNRASQLLQVSQLGGPWFCQRCSCADRHP
jgi:hypothetical protein